MAMAVRPGRCLDMVPSEGPGSILWNFDCLMIAPKKDAGKTAFSSWAGG